MDRTKYFNKNRIVYTGYAYTPQMCTQYIISCINFLFLADITAQNKFGSNSMVNIKYYFEFINFV